MNFNFDTADEAKKIIKTLNRFSDPQVEEILNQIKDLAP